MAMHSLQAERTWLDVHENEAQSPCKKARGVANLQSSQKISISRACETKLWCVLSFLENANDNNNNITPTTLGEWKYAEENFSNQAWTGAVTSSMLVRCSKS